MKIIFVWLLAIVFLIDSVLRAIRSSFNLGVLMMYLITAALWIYALFHTKIDAFCAAGAGRVLKIIFFCCCAVRNRERTSIVTGNDAKRRTAVK